MSIPYFLSSSSWSCTQRSGLYSLVLSIMLMISPDFAHSYVAPLYCSYDKLSRHIRCDVNLEGLVITDVSLNDGQCTVPSKPMDEAAPTVGSPLANGSSKQPELRSYKGTYEEGDTFYIFVDPNCDLKTYSVKANGKVWQFDYKPAFPLYDPF